MAKTKSRWACQQCGFQTSRFLGKCTDCGAWSSLVEELSIEEDKKGFAQRLASAGEVQTPTGSRSLPLTEIETDETERISTCMNGLDEVLGGGLVPGAVILLAGDPGIGKSTLLMQVAKNLAIRHKVLYITGEESAAQVKLRAQRLAVTSANVLVAAEQNVVAAYDLMKGSEAAVCVVDSIQSIYHPEISSAAGSVSQVREGTQLLIHAAKARNMATILVGHVTKEGTIAGPRVLEHMVDVVLQFEGDNLRQLRLLRAVKNRFGSTNELAIFSMMEEGLKEVDNPSALFLGDRLSKVGVKQAPSGTAVIAGGEGNRSLLLEVQALTVATPNPSPRRVTNGWDYNRLLQLLAVLEKRAQLSLSRLDVYVNIVGGMDFNDPAGDLGIALAVATAFLDRSIDPGLVAVGEVGLTGEVRPVINLAQRLKEAQRLGFTRALVPMANLIGSDAQGVTKTSKGRGKDKDKGSGKADSEGNSEGEAKGEGRGSSSLPAGIEVVGVETLNEALTYAMPNISFDRKPQREQRDRGEQREPREQRDRAEQREPREQRDRGKSMQKEAEFEAIEKEARRRQEIEFEDIERENEGVFSI